ncbi:MAG: superoxide dismutase [Pyrinomonadaceae bacterium]|nr:superoxide dismutase [Pyrinomonadaceae bacterium]
MNISRRAVLLGATYGFASLIVKPAVANRDGVFAQTTAATSSAQSSRPHKLPPLPYDFAALEPHIDAQTMQLHHGKHHATYVTRLNEALAKHTALQNKSPEELIRDMNSVPEDIRTAVRNNGGGHVNHTMFWQIMKPQGGGEPSGQIAEVIKKTFGGFDTFKKQFNDAGARQFGSGWVWLVRSRQGKYEIVTTPNQDNPVMMGHLPILGNDVWEHAYYLKYQNRRPEYLQAWWNTVNWDEINKRLGSAARS